MSFIDGMYSFFVELNDSDKEFFDSVKFKAVKHPEESLDHLIARVLAYLHAYQEGIEFSQGLFEPKEPCIWAKDVTEKTTLWAEIGVPPKKKLMHALKQLTEASIRVYFLSEDEIIEFCHHMRGAKTNWVERAEFFLLDQNLIDELAEQLSLRSYWSLSICDHILYLAANESNFQSPVTLVNIWEWYQESLMENSAS